MKPKNDPRSEPGEPADPGRTKLLARAYEAFHLEVKRAMIQWHTDPEGKAMDTCLDIDEALHNLRNRLPENPSRRLREWEEIDESNEPVDPRPSPEEQAMFSEETTGKLSKLTERMLGSLTSKEQEILEKRFGIKK
jgi:DNA-directed RNA polymerase sigma subunit (sigma70/sigma32)